MQGGRGNYSIWGSRGAGFLGKLLKWLALEWLILTMILEYVDNRTLPIFLKP